MILVLIGAAIAVGVGAAVFLWPYGAVVALIGAAVVASAVVGLAAVVLASTRAQSGDERAGIANLLTHITGRRDRR